MGPLPSNRMICTSVNLVLEVIHHNHHYVVRRGGTACLRQAGATSTAEWLNPLARGGYREMLFSPPIKG